MNETVNIPKPPPMIDDLDAYNARRPCTQREATQADIDYCKSLASGGKDKYTIREEMGLKHDQWPPCLWKALREGRAIYRQKLRKQAAAHLLKGEQEKAQAIAAEVKRHRTQDDFPDIPHWWA